MLLNFQNSVFLKNVFNIVFLSQNFIISKYNFFYFAKVNYPWFSPFSLPSALGLWGGAQHPLLPAILKPKEPSERKPFDSSGKYCLTCTVLSTVQH